MDVPSLVPLDRDTIVNSVKKTRRLVIVDEEPRTASAAAEIAAGRTAEKLSHSPLRN